MHDPGENAGGLDARPYYIDFDRSLGEDFSEYTFDRNGVPRARYYRTSEWTHNPVTVCQYALSRWNRYLGEKDESDRIRFLAQADWLVEKGEPGPGNARIWPYRHDLYHYRIRAPWISGMAQGEALSVLTRAWALTGETRYRDTALRAWKVIPVPVDSGGVLSRFSDGDPVVEEYPTSAGTTAVLNGFCFALFGIYDLYHAFGDREVFLFFQDLSRSLKRHLKLYDTGYWTRYELWPPGRLASVAYHRIHIRQMEVMAGLSGETAFQETAGTWRGYLHSPRCRARWAMVKIRQKWSRIG